MLLTKVVLDNFGVYRESNEFDFHTTLKKPIVLIGGKNGAGKTTLFESLMLCLYGQDSFDEKLSKKQYLDIISRSFHRYLGVKKSATSSSITVEFEFAHDNETFVYQVQRSWQNNDGKIEEELIIKKKKPSEETFENLDSLEVSEWQMFINQLIPRGIAKLFFFDGEKIQKIAQEGSEDEYIRSSFDTLLGLDIVNQLNRDLRYTLDRIQEESKINDIEDKIEKAEKERENFERELERNLIKQASLKREIYNIQKKILVKEERFAKLGGQFYERREELLSAKHFHENKISTIEKEIRELCSTTLPFSLIPNQLEDIKKEIQSDQQKIQANFEKDILEKNFKEILSKINSKSFLSDIDEKTKSNIYKELSFILDEKLDSLSSSHNTTFNFSPQDMIKTIQFIDDIKENDPKKIESLTKAYNDEIESINRISVELESVPKDNEIGPLRSEINELNKELGHIEEQLEELKIQESIKRHYLNKENKVIRVNLSHKFSGKKLVDGLELGPKVQAVLEEYSSLLRAKKLELLEAYILDGLKMLLHKQDFIDNVKINKETFEVKLYKQNDEISKNMLSQGELQMFATAVVWGLAKTSGRPLPFMIDTPLARLDDEHRVNLVENFFPFASHQIIIFSTNSEITDSLYKKLEPYITNSFVIQYNSNKGKTARQDGYFFEQIGERIIEV